MAAAFNLTAELNLRGPSNLNQVVSSIRRELSTVSLDLTIDPRTSSGIRTITSNVNTLSAALRNAQSNAAALDSTLRNLASSLGSSATNINNLNQNINNTTTSITNLRNRSRDATNEVEAFGRQAGLAVRRFAAFSTVTGVIYGLSRALSSAYGEFVNFNKEFVRLQQVTNQSASGLEGLSKEISRLSQGLGVSSASLLQVSTTLAQAGLSANETKRALEALAKSALAPSFDDLNSTVEGSIALMRQFGISAGDLEASLGSINAVAAKFAVEAGDIIAAIQRTGGVFAAASKGVSEGKDALNEFIAVFTSVRATTRESAETIATGLRTIFTRIQRGGTIEALKEYGVQLTDVEGKFVGAYEAVRRLSEGLSKIDPRDIRFSRIVEELGGFRQIGKVIPLIQQFSTAQQALSVAQRGSASLTQDAATAQLALAVRITKVREEFIGLIREIGQSQGFQKFVDISLQLASGLIAVADAAKGVLPALTAIIALRGISNIGTFVGGFSQSLSGSGGGRRGGRRGFARGGFVPGVGNGDTVPAMLTPGEFVIRKKAVQTIGVGKLAALNRSSGGYVPTQNFQSGGRVQKFAQTTVKPNSGRVKKAPLVDDIANNATGTILPRPQIALSDIISAGGGAIDVDRTVKRTEGDQAYARAKTPEQREAVKKKYFLDPAKRLEDIRLSRLTQFGKELQVAIRSGKIDPNKLSIVSKSTRVPGVAEHLHKLFGIPVANMAFTSGGSKQKFMDALREKGPRAQRVRRFMFGGEVQKFAQKGTPASAGRVKQPKIPYYKDQKQVEKAIAKTSVRKFGLVGILGGAGKGSAFNQTLLAKPKSMDPVPVQVSIGTLQKKNSRKATSLDKMIKTDFGKTVEKTAIRLGNILKAKSSSQTAPLDKIVNNAGFQQVVGAAFEGALNMVGSPFFEKAEKTKSMDFPFGIGAPASLFGIPPNIPTDATRTIGSKGKGPGGFIKQIERYLEAENQELYSQKLQAIKSQGGASSTSDEIRRLTQNPKDKQAISNILSENRGPAIPRQVNRQNVADNYFTNTLPQALANNPRALSEVEAYIRRKAGFSPMGSPRSLLRRATGGGISGQDTVPALLTPGEFVINKKAASRLGSSKLNKLNRADKIQGFNSGGAVGNIPSFAGGGMMEASFRALERVVTSLTRSLQNFGRRTQQTGLMPPGGGSVLNRARSLRTQGLEGDDFRSAMRREGFIKNLMKDPMTLMFGAGMAGDMISKSGSPALGAAVTGGASAAGVMATLAPMIGLTGPFGALLTVTTGLVAAYNDYQQALKDIIIAENTKKLETETALLEGAFQRLARTSKITSESFNEIGLILTNMQNYSDSIVRAQAEKATPSSFAVAGGNLLDALLSSVTTAGLSVGSLFSGIAGRGFFDPRTVVNTGIGTIGKQQQSELASNIYTASKPMADAASRSVSEIMMRTGKSFEQAVNVASGGDENRRAGILRGIAITQSGDRIAQLEARKEALGSQFVAGQLSQTDYARSLGFINQSISITIDEAVKAFAMEAREKQKVVKATYAVVNSVNAFNEALKNISAGVDRASAQFSESVRVMDIRAGGPGQIGGPSRMNENVIGNLRAYTAQEVSSTMSSLGSTLGLDRGFVQKTTENLLIQQKLEQQLPTIFGKLAGMQRVGEGAPKELEIELRKLFAPLKLDPSTLQNVIKELEGNFNELASSGSNVSSDELATKSDTLRKVMEGFTNSQRTAIDIAKALNDVQSTMSQKLTEYVSKLELAIEAQIKAANIREQGALDLKEAMGQSVSLAERNAVFDNTITRLTSSVDSRGNIAAGTGTIDPNIIAARYRAAEDRRIALEDKKTAQGGQLNETEALELARVNVQANNFAKALEKLSSDTTKAAAALQEIQKLRQAQQGRSNMFMDFVSNLNNPDWMMELAMNTARYRGVMTGDRRATIRDLPGARQGLEFATQGMTPEQATEARERFQRETLKILMRPLEQGGMGLDRASAERIYGQIAGDPEGQMRSAIDLYNEAINNQAEATEKLGEIAKSAGKQLYDDIVAAGKAFAASVRGSVAANAPIANGQAPIVPGGNANGGLIYANKGRYVDYKPRGTDTVPAMLTPGEFVVNARATKKNLGLLKAINSGSKGYSKGGLVYLQDGGFVSSVDEEISSIQQQINEFDAETERLAQEIGLSRKQGFEIDPVGLERIQILRDARKKERRQLDEKLMLLQTTRQYEVDQDTAKKNFDKDAAAKKAEENIPLVIPEDDREARKQQLIAQQEQQFNAEKARAERRIGAYEKWQRDKQAEQQAAEARKTPREKYQEAKKAEMDRRKAAFEADREARRSRFLANNPRLAEKEEERKTREDIEKEQALTWWNTTGRWDSDQDISATQYTPDDVVKRYKKATLAERIEINNAELRVRQQRDIAARSRPGPIKPKSTGPIVAADIFNESDMAQQARADQAGRMYWSQLMLTDGTSYTDVPADEQEKIYKDLLSGRPVGYNSLKPRQQQDLDLYIERWIRQYEAKQTQDFKASQQAQAAAQEEAEKRASEQRAIAIRAETETRRKADEERERAINQRATDYTNKAVAEIQARSAQTLEERKAKAIEEGRANVAGGVGDRRLRQTIQQRKEREALERKKQDTPSLDRTAANFYSMYEQPTYVPGQVDPRMASMLNSAQEDTFVRTSQQLARAASGGFETESRIQLEDLQREHGPVVAVLPNGNIKFLDGFNLINTSGPDTGDLALAALDFIPGGKPTKEGGKLVAGRLAARGKQRVATYVESGRQQAQNVARADQALAESRRRVADLTRESKLADDAVRANQRGVEEIQSRFLDAQQERIAARAVRDAPSPTGSLLPTKPNMIPSEFVAPPPGSLARIESLGLENLSFNQNLFPDYLQSIQPRLTPGQGTRGTLLPIRQAQRRGAQSRRLNATLGSEPISFMEPRASNLLGEAAQEADEAAKPVTRGEAKAAEEARKKRNTRAVLGAGTAVALMGTVYYRSAESRAQQQDDINFLVMKGIPSSEVGGYTPEQIKKAKERILAKEAAKEASAVSATQQQVMAEPDINTYTQGQQPNEMEQMQQANVELIEARKKVTVYGQGIQGKPEDIKAYYDALEKLNAAKAAVRARAARATVTPQTKSRGGLIYASRGTLVPYQPIGTDTVPAMLTPGEFVINRKAAKQHMGLLKAINNGQNVKPQHLSFGGIVQPKYYEAGTSGSGVSGSSAVSGVLKSIGIDTSSIEAVFSNFQTYVTNFASSISQFVQASTNLGSLSAALGSLSQLNLVTPAESLRNASVSLKDASNTLTNSIGLFNTTAADLAAAISKIPPNISLTVTGSLPVTGTINVIIDGGTDLSPENSQLVQDAVFNKIGLAINSATAGGLNILQS